MLKAMVTSPFQGKGKASSSFLKKRTKRLLLLRRSHDRGHGRDLAVGTRRESLLLLFFRKEGLCLAFLQNVINTP
jgi:hypothetical protein